MEKDEIFYKIQEIISHNPVIVLGSGASIPYGIASMEKLASKLKVYFASKKYGSVDADDCVKKFINNLDANMGLEDALLNVRATEAVEHDIVNVVWQTVAEEDKEVYECVLNGQNIDLADLFNYLVYNRPEHAVNVVSTNYDKIAEYAVCQTRAYLNTSFSPFLMGTHLDRLNDCKVQNLENYVGVINLWKIHGSLDWFRKDDKVIALPNTYEVPTGYIPCIITPGTNKYEKINQDPHRALLEQIDESFKSASGYLCIGYGFNDSHVHPRILSYSKERRKTIIIVTKEITSAIQKNVMEGGCNYFVIVSDGADGTDIYSSESIDKFNIPDKIYWNVSGLCGMLK